MKYLFLPKKTVGKNGDWKDFFLYKKYIFMTTANNFTVGPLLTTKVQRFSHP